MTDVVECKAERFFRYHFGVFKGESVGSGAAKRALKAAEGCLEEVLAYARLQGYDRLLQRYEGKRDAIAAARAAGGEAAVHALPTALQL